MGFLKAESRRFCDIISKKGVVDMLAENNELEYLLNVTDIWEDEEDNQVSVNASYWNWLGPIYLY